MSDQTTLCECGSFHPLRCWEPGCSWSFPHTTLAQYDTGLTQWSDHVRTEHPIAHARINRSVNATLAQLKRPRRRHGIHTTKTP